MRLIKILIVLVLIPLFTFNLCLPGVSLAGTPTAYDQPESLSTPEEDMPVEKIVVKRKTWVWVLIALAAAGGGAAAAGGGGGGDSSSSGSGGTGSGTITW